nr:hypothetical protein Iba_chr03bCG12230 [Ipomoea batatas]
MEISKNSPDPQRYSEDSDLLERSTRKRKVTANTSGNVSPGSTDSTPLEQLSTTAVEVVPETPLNDPTGTAMLIENDRGIAHDTVAEHDTESPPQALPRSYRDSVVGSGADAAPFLLADLSDDDDSCPHTPVEHARDAADRSQEGSDQGETMPHTAHQVANTVGNNITARRTTPYGSWMIVTRKDRRQTGRAPSNGNQSAPTGRSTPLGEAVEAREATGSRYAPLETTDGPNIDLNSETNDQPQRRADKQPAGGTSAVPRQASPARRANQHFASEDTIHQAELDSISEIGQVKKWQTAEEGGNCLMRVAE